MSLPVLIREVRARRPLTRSLRPRPSALAVGVGVVLGFALVAGAVVGQRAFKQFGDSKRTITSLQAKEYASPAYTAWKQDNPDRACPAALAELNRYIPRQNLDDIADLWGSPMIMLCTPSTLYVFSSGPDRIPYTGDDIKSWE